MKGEGDYVDDGRQTLDFFTCDAGKTLDMYKKML